MGLVIHDLHIRFHLIIRFRSKILTPDDEFPKFVSEKESGLWIGGAGERK
jgi:hypothetical protein